MPDRVGVLRLHIGSVARHALPNYAYLLGGFESSAQISAQDQRTVRMNGKQRGKAYTSATTFTEVLARNEADLLRRSVVNAVAAPGLERAGFAALLGTLDVPYRAPPFTRLVIRS